MKMKMKRKMKKGKILRITLLSVTILLCFHGALCYKAPADQWLEKHEKVRFISSQTETKCHMTYDS